MVASIFLASKVENEILKAESISLATKDQNKEVTVNQIVQHELLLLRGIGFQVSVHVCVRACARARVCVCEREREREGERGNSCMCCQQKKTKTHGSTSTDMLSCLFYPF